MNLAVVSRQPFLDLLRWHPRDVDTLEQIYQEQASEGRMAAAREQAKQYM